MESTESKCAKEAKPHLERVETLRVREVRLIAALDRLVRGERTVEIFEELGTLCRDAGFEPRVVLDGAEMETTIGTPATSALCSVPSV